ncbi:ubiquitin carboxyl-terminal hydrolase 16-like [Coffea arabica]|uniref:Ubiquitin carboxyl-terminal hydrolase 16-like n=1 Tax=Coffea arabica TaxID=13443 RepID=A0ABM4W2C2_COFAR
MLLGGDLGFLARVVVAFFVVIFVPVVGFVVRLKWRRSVARREEIKRLLVLVSEETARAELEAEGDFGYGYDDGHNGYGYSSSLAEVAAEEPVPESVAEVEGPVEVNVGAQPPAAAVQAPRRLPYQCEVCSSPTTTRCARCKAVRYCSGKCQIIHWRQGHKDECQPFTFDDQSHKMGITSPVKLKAKQNEIHKNSFETGVRYPAKADETSSGEASDSSLSNSSDWAENEVDISTDEKERISKSKLIAPMISEVSRLTSSGSSIDASASAVHNQRTSHGHQPVHFPVKTDGDHANVGRTKPSPEHSNLVTSGVNSEPISVDVDTLCGSSTSSASSVDGCSESSFSEPSTSSSGFWDGTINRTRSRIDAVDDTSHSCDAAAHVDLSSSEFSSPCSFESPRSVLPQKDMTGFCDEKALSDDPHTSPSEEKKPTNGSSSPVKLNKDDLASSALCLKRPEHVDFRDFSTRKVLKSRDPVDHAMSKDVKAGSLPSLNSEKVNCKVAGQSSIPQESKSVEVKSFSSKASTEHLSPNYGTYTVQNVKSVKADSAHELPACASSCFDHSENARNSSKPSVWKVVDEIRASKLTRLAPLGGMGENVGKYYNKGLFPYDLFVKLYNWNKVELLPCGLLNCGNSCYANVVLQCLAFTPPLTAYFLQGLHSRACKKRGWCFTCEFESLVLKAKDGNSPISPSRIISQLQNIGSNLGNGREEDAHEFLRCAIDTMQSGCLNEAGISASGTLEETTLLGLTFGGYLRSKIECMRCGGKSERQEKIMDLTVEIGGDIGTLEEALRQFTHTETLDGENKYHCSRCKSYEKAKKKLRVLEAPNILTIALKRFQSGKFGKLNKTIRFPEILDLAPYMSGTSDKSPIYRLYGVIVHLDIMNAAFSGHYVCYVKNTQNKWFKIDDSMVNAVELERVLTKGAYMLLYARCSPRAPRLIRSTLVPRDPRKSRHPDSKPRYHHARGPWDIHADDSSNNETNDERACPNYSSFQPFRTIWEEDSSSDKSSSFFSEVNSCSTDSSARDSMCSDDLFDQMLGIGDMGVYYGGSSWRNASDSETSSSSSSPSPLYSRHPLHDLEAYASKYPEETDECIDTAVPTVDDRPRLPGRTEVEVTGGRGTTLCPDSGKESTPFLCPDSTKRCRKLGSSSCRETGSSKLGWINFENWKSSVTFRRPTRERSD